MSKKQCSFIKIRFNQLSQICRGTKYAAIIAYNRHLSKTSPIRYNGLKEQINTKLNGRNIGHAALRIVIPVDATNAAEGLINKYCYENGNIVLPFQKNKLSNGEEIYEVYISGWQESGKVTLDRNFIQDSNAERLGVDFQWDPEWEKKFSIDKRIYGGIVGGTTMQLGPESIIHKRSGMSEKEYSELQDIYAFKSYVKQSHQYEFLSERLNEFTFSKKISLDRTSKLLFDKLIPNWKLLIKNPSKLSKIELTNLIQTVEKAKSDYKNLAENYTIRNKIETLAERALLEIKINLNSDLKRWGKITPDTAEKLLKHADLIGISSELKIAQILQFSNDYTRSESFLGVAELPPHKG